MTWMPFMCLGAGFLIALKQLSDRMLKAFDAAVNAALIILMITIGMNIGINDSVMQNLGSIGVNCAIISLCATACSVILVVLVEKTVLPLKALQEKLHAESLNINSEVDIEQERDKKISPLVWIMPASIVSGVAAGYFLMSVKQQEILGTILLLSLVLLYTSVGISLGVNRKVFGYIRVLGFKVLYIPIAIFAGSMAGGLLSGTVLEVPLHVSVISAGGMSYYSLTGAYMTSACGIEAGTYGFVVNVMREFFTVILLPLLIRISKGSPIAAGAAGCMDTMLVPVTKFVGAELGLVALIAGVILTFAVPIILPLLYGVCL